MFMAIIGAIAAVSILTISFAFFSSISDDKKEPSSEKSTSKEGNDDKKLKLPNKTKGVQSISSIPVPSAKKNNSVSVPVISQTFSRKKELGKTGSIRK